MRIGTVVYLSQAHALRDLKIGKRKLIAWLADGRAVMVGEIPAGKAGEVARILTAAAHIREDAATEWDGDDTRVGIHKRRRSLLKAVYYFRKRHGHGLFDGPAEG